MEAAKNLRIQRMSAVIVRIAGLSRRLVCVVFLALSGCTFFPTDPPSEPLSEIVPPQRELLPDVVVDTSSDSAPPEAARPIAIVVSSRLAAYLDVADSLASQLGADEYVTHVLADEAESESGVDELPSYLFERELKAVVAVGLPAALFATEHIEAPLIFCQVFNYSDYPELERATAGVSMLAAFDEQLAFWKAMDASLESVGTIVGPGHEQLIARSTAAAAAQGIALNARVTNSDRETVYQFKRLSADIDGFWLIPDNRILSTSAIQELMSYAASRRLPVVVSTPELLRFGALMSLAPSASHVADSVLSVLSSLQNYISGGFEIVDPREFDVDVNQNVAARLGLGSY